ncbi:unnamed protein product [Cladocopium goreaui]|uniref:Uncharacterized protein n=1 Tax=Cladocopium goreaui TaxID=2562237 RepID=A0A9P1FMI4_9DINO|nr:unnamed protein product [Cladocopium goreaui]
MAFTIAARLAATKAVVPEEMPLKSWIVWFFVLMEVGSLGTFLQLGYFVHPGLLLIPAFLQVTLSATRAAMQTSHSSSLHDPRRQVYFALFSQGFSAFGLARRQKAATTFYIGTTLLRVGCLIPVLFFLIGSNMCEAPIDRGAGRSYPKVWKAENGISGIHEFRAELCKIYGDANSLCDVSAFSCFELSCFGYSVCGPGFNKDFCVETPGRCQLTCWKYTQCEETRKANDLVELPNMLQESCMLHDFDFLKFQACAAESKLLNSCNARASACRLPYMSRSFGDGIFFFYILLPMFCLLGWLLIFILSSIYFRDGFLITAEEDKDRRKTVRRRAMKLGREMLQQKATLMERTRAYLALAMFCFDLASDGSCLAGFLMTGQWGFAAAQASIVLVAAATEFWRGSPRELLEAFTDFRQTGVPPDKFLSIIQAEQGLEAPLSFLLQYYSAFFTSGSEWAFLNLCFSISMSLYGISKGVYDNIHLNMEAAFDAAELLDQDSASEPPTPHAQPPAVVGFPSLPPGMAQPHQTSVTPLPPPPGMSPVMALAVTQPPPPVGPIQLGGPVKDTE